MRYIDPDGLILFAFDGTGNDESNPSTLSNVVYFRDLYASDGGLHFYITGPGTLDPRTGFQNPWYKGGDPADMAASLTGKERVARLIKDLQDYADEMNDSEIINIDIVGFSRGAAQARDFANQIAASTQDGWYRYTSEMDGEQCQKINFRFLGLWDTVLSTHTGSYALTIPDEFAYVVQAVALNEYRGNLVAFPLESIMGGPVPAGQTRIERGFLGAHSDIGGGFPDGDLAKVALIWMVDHANAAGVDLKPLTAEQTTIIANPVLHDRSTNLLQGSPAATSEDRTVRYLDGSTEKQRQADTFGMNWKDTLAFITYKPAPNTLDSIAGTVDMLGYLEWLNNNGDGVTLNVQ